MARPGSPAHVTPVRVPLQGLTPAARAGACHRLSPAAAQGPGCVIHKGGSPEAPSACHFLGGWETTARPERGHSMGNQGCRKREASLRSHCTRQECQAWFSLLKSEQLLSSWPQWALGP